MSYRDTGGRREITCPDCQHPVPDGARYCPYCRTPIRASDAGGDPFVGRTIQGRYFVETRIGSGGMGSVYKGVQHRLDRVVAIKVLNPTLLTDPSIVQRFVREARAASQLHHPNVIAVTDFGQLEDGTLFMVMDFCRGRNLLSLIRDRYPIGERWVIHIGAQILGALAEAHAQGIIHRDLKPENVMVEARRDDPDFVKVLDFGIAKIREPGDDDGALTRPGFICGTPAYMSPEQAAALEIDERSDLYSTGVILYQMLARNLPFDAASPSEMVRKVLTAPVPPLAQRAPFGTAVSPDVEAVVMRSLAKKPEDRYASALEMRAALLACRIDAAFAEPAQSSTLVLDSKTIPLPKAQLSPAPNRTPVEPAPSANPQVAPSPSGASRVKSQVQEPPDAAPSEAGLVRGPTPTAAGPLGARMRPWMGLAAAAGLIAVGGIAIGSVRARQGSKSPPPESVAAGTRRAPQEAPRPIAAHEPADSPGASSTTKINEVASSTAKTSAVTTPAESEPASNATTNKKPQSASHSGSPDTSGKKVPAAQGAGTAAASSTKLKIVEKSDMIGALNPPSIATGDGLLGVSAEVVGRVYVNDEYVGETPIELRVAADTYRVRVTNKKFGSDSTRIRVAAGRRILWTAAPK